MAWDWNVFKLLADTSHFSSKCILIWSIHTNKSAEGVSLITQTLYLLVFCSRYLPFPLWSSYDPQTFHKVWNTVLKPFYILTSAYIIFLMMRVYARTREREKAWKIGGWSLGGSLVTAPFIMMIFREKNLWTFPEFCYSMSLILESTCIIPQLLLLRQTSVPTVIDSFYLATLGSYRAFYLLNWLVRAVRDQYYDPISVVFGLIQTALYIDFAWVYWTRQRVKLRGGAVVDSDDLSKGWLISRFVRRGDSHDDIESTPASYGRDGAGEEDGNNPRHVPKTWGPRGISVSADEGVLEGEDQHTLPQSAPQRLASPSHFEDDDGGESRQSEESDDEFVSFHDSTIDDAAKVGNGIEWRDDGAR